MNIRVCASDDKGVLDWIMMQNNPLGAALFGGDRWDCCDEVVVVHNDSGDIIGIATISPQGEQFRGQPSIVGIYLPVSERGKGLGTQLLKATILRMQECGLAEPYRVDAITSGMVKLVDGLPSDFRPLIEVYKSIQPMFDQLVSLGIF